MTRNATGWRGRPNQTAADALARIRTAREDYMRLAGGEYLTELEHQLSEWHKEVREELVRRSKSNR